MNNKSSLSLFACCKKAFVAFRQKYGFKNRRSMTEFAQDAGLPVEYLEHFPQHVAGFLDSHPEPRFIAVNRGLPAHDRAFFIARQIGLRAHQQRYNSLVLDRPWKWATLDAAPAGLKEKISQLDIEFRAHLFMMAFTTGDEFRAFIRANPKRFCSGTFTDNIVRYHLSKVWVKLWFAKIYRYITLAGLPTA